MAEAVEKFGYPQRAVTDHLVIYYPFLRQIPDGRCKIERLYDTMDLL